MIGFSQIEELEEIYYEWIKELNATDCVFNVISFLVEKGLLDVEKVELFLEGDSNE